MLGYYQHFELQMDGSDDLRHQVGRADPCNKTGFPAGKGKWKRQTNHQKLPLKPEGRFDYVQCDLDLDLTTEFFRDRQNGELRHTINRNFSFVIPSESPHRLLHMDLHIRT